MNAASAARQAGLAAARLRPGVILLLILQIYFYRFPHVLTSPPVVVAVDLGGSGGGLLDAASLGGHVNVGLGSHH